MTAARKMMVAKFLGFFGIYGQAGSVIRIREIVQTILKARG